MVDLPKNSIIFNHEQTKNLLEHGHISSRGKAYAEGNAHLTIYPNGSSKDQWKGTGYSSWDDPTWDAAEALKDAAKDLSDAAGNSSDATDDFRETFDWIEVRLEELEERFSLKEAKLENAVSSEAKNKIIDSMLKDNQEMYDTLIASADTYYAHANKILMDVDKIPAAYRAAAQNGAIAIEEFTGELGEEALNAIQEYREWAQKAADAKQQAEEKKTQAAELARQKFDNTEERWDLKVETRDNKNAKIEAAIDLAEAKGEPVSDRYYEKLIDNTNDKKGRLTKKRDAMQADLDSAVKSGDIKKYSNDWYEMVAAISGVDEEIIQCDTDIEGFKNSINEIAWDGFDTVIERFENVSDEAQNLIDILSSKELVDDSGNWTNAGVASLGLYAQQMEYSKAMAQEYSDAIKGLETDYKLGAVSESEYAEKLAELKKGQYASIKAYEDSKDAIKDLQKTRIDAIKKGIDKEIEAYEKLIKKKKEALDADKDAHDFAKSSMDHQKNIAELERKLAALAGDTSASAAAERARLNAELSEAKAEQEEFYYDRSVSNQQEAYDKELENFTETKEAEKEQWDEWLEDTSAVIGDAFTTIQAQAEVVNVTLKDLASEYGLELSNAITSPWENAQDPMNLYWDSFTTTGSTAITALKQELVSFQEALNKAEEDAKNTLNQQAQEQKTYTQAEYQEPQKPATNGNNGNNGNNNGNGNTGSGTPKVGGTVTVKKTATHFGSKSGNQKMASFVPGGSYTVYEISGSGANAQVLIGKNGSYTGWVKLSDLTGYSTSSGSGSGTSGSGTGTTVAPKKGASVTVKTSATNYSANSGSKKMASFVPGGTYTVMETAGSGDKTQVLIGKNGTATGWVWLKDLKGYAKGTTGVKQSQLAWIDELGEELVMHADGSGKLSFLSKGSSVIPHDLTENLMSWGELDPSNMLESNRPSIGVSPEVHNTEINLDCSVGTLVNIERCEQGTLPDVEKIVNKAFEKHMSNLNNSLKKYVR